MSDETCECGHKLTPRGDCAGAAHEHFSILYDREKAAREKAERDLAALRAKEDARDMDCRRAEINLDQLRAELAKERERADVLFEAGRQQAIARDAMGMAPRFAPATGPHSDGERLRVALAELREERIIYRSTEARLAAAEACLAEIDKAVAEVHQDSYPNRVEGAAFACSDVDGRVAFEKAVKVITRERTIAAAKLIAKDAEIEKLRKELAEVRR